MAVQDYINPRDLMFWLYEVGQAGELCRHAPFDALDRAGVEAMLDTSLKLAAHEFDGLAHEVDEREPYLKDGAVISPPMQIRALRAYAETGLPSASFPAQYGGMDMPGSIAMALRMPVDAVGGSSVGYLFLTTAAANMLSVVGTEAQKARYLPPMVAMRWFGTMMLSETQAGSSLGDIRCKARRQPDGSYHLTGSKMWISGADQDISENIIHMVLAKIEDEQGNVVAGSKGISLFLVPKFRINADGSLGVRNGVTISGLNHKMGQRGIVNTVPVLGDGAPCVGELLGQPGEGLAGMFHMMNEARIGIGHWAAVSGYAGYRYSLSYAKERPQGRPLNDPDVRKPQVPIIQHADVRRMLLAQKAMTEGALALTLYAAELVDRAHIATAQEERQRLEQLLAILTPMVKTWPSTWCLHANYLAIQVLGGYGYTRDYPVERLYRDNRLNEIHEGTTGIQSLDLMGRKILKDGGASLSLLMQEMQATMTLAARHTELKEAVDALRAAQQRVHETTVVLGREAKAGRMDVCMANSVTYLDMLGHVVIAWMWLRMAITAADVLPQASPADRDFYQGKLQACRYFCRWELPRTQTQAALLQSLDMTPSQTTIEQF